ncbi:YlxR family protein [Corynebacterium sp. ES2794-CONJ1]|uniref:YlxR family protein n=1 Tax=unclassified Corynebacterium TaxID=2624378 RepID=UPI00216A15EA|nr:MULTISPECIES: YlxR family protein [unclassified Corynebacterium]MCS4489123.1 YlxR family protein [Corynebacterium sp. ES2775-CONJ]MCS4490936.1 YlxR family protein [Corynebacterium sp. ES2715-CONJ3]MCS4531182.1 YlxR family protein [Corynebacterium sp. ES2730-CONJ]MCU9518550.1 YlxR family protein [Corynebacterium sp. ES2794-CONJ1]
MSSSFMQSSPGDGANAPTIRIRTCIAFRTRAHDSTLLRVVLSSNKDALVPDPHRRLPGRGCWITPNLEAVELAEKQRAFTRSLRVSGPLDTRSLRQHIQASHEHTKEIERDRTLMSTS